MEQSQIELVEKWLVTCVLRGVDPKEQYEVQEHLSTLSHIQELERHRDPELLAARDAINMGLNEDIVDRYYQHLENLENLRIDREQRAEEESNKTLQRLNNKHKMTFTEGPSQYQVYWTFEIGDKKIKSRIVTVSWGEYRIWTEWLDGKEKKKHCENLRVSYGKSYKPKWFPEHWKETHRMTDRQLAFYYTHKLIKEGLPL